MNTESDLDRRLATLKSTLATAAPPPSVDAAVEAAIAGRRSASRVSRVALWKPRRLLPAWIAGLAAMAAAIGFVAFIDRHAQMLSTPDTDVPSATDPGKRSWFLPVVPVSEWAASDDALVVQARLSRMTLAQLGVPVNPAQAADAVDAELLVRGDGAVLAVRLPY